MREGNARNFPKQIDLKLLSWPTTSPFEPQNKQIPTHFQTTVCLLSSNASILGGGVAGLGLGCKSAAVWVIVVEIWVV